jgi:transposase
MSTITSMIENIGNQMSYLTNLILTLVSDRSNNMAWYQRNKPDYVTSISEYSLNLSKRQRCTSNVEGYDYHYINPTVDINQFGNYTGYSSTLHDRDDTYESI